MPAPNAQIERHKLHSSLNLKFPGSLTFEDPCLATALEKDLKVTPL